MPRGNPRPKPRKKTRPRPRTPKAAAPDARYLWGIAEIAHEISRDYDAVAHMLHRGLFRSVRKVGERWCAEREALHAELRGEAAE